METHSHTVPGGRGVWNSQRLWELAADLPVFQIAIADIPEFDRDCWFRGVAPSIRKVAEHARRINGADRSHPIIFSASGVLMDGGHRIAQAWLAGDKEISAVRFATDPEPDQFQPADPTQPA